VRKVTKFFVLAFAILVVFPLCIHAQTDDDLKTQVDDLVFKHYFEGIQYVDANALGPDAIQYLVELLNNPDKKEFWVNIIATLGFIEDSTALYPLTSFLENAQGEVDYFTYRALMSVPFAIGCIGSNGDSMALDYLVDIVDDPKGPSYKWSYKNKNLHRNLTEYAIMGLIVSGHPRAEAKLKKIKDQIDKNNGPPEHKVFKEHVNNGIKDMGRFKGKGRSQIFNPQRDN